MFRQSPYLLTPAQTLGLLDCKFLYVILTLRESNCDTAWLFEQMDLILLKIAEMGFVVLELVLDECWVGY
jgi:hypothetical protein